MRLCYVYLRLNVAPRIFGINFMLGLLLTLHNSFVSESFVRVNEYRFNVLIQTIDIFAKTKSQLQRKHEWKISKFSNLIKLFTKWITETVFLQNLVCRQKVKMAEVFIILKTFLVYC